MAAAGIFHCYMEYAALKGAAGSNVTLQDLGFQTDITVYLQIRQTWLAFSEYTQTDKRTPDRHINTHIDEKRSDSLGPSVSPSLCLSACLSLARSLTVCLSLTISLSLQ